MYPEYKNNALIQRAYENSLKLFQFGKVLPNKREFWIIYDQVFRSATSIGANLVEAQASVSRLEFKRYYQIALKSANETVYWLHMIMVLGYRENADLQKLTDESKELSKMIGSAVLKLKK